MPSSVRHDPPAARKKGRSGVAMQGCAAPKLRDTLEHIAGQIGEADKRQGTAFADMQERLVQLGHKVDGVRAGLPKSDTAALVRIEDSIDTLSQQIAHLDETQLRQRGPAPTTSPRSNRKPAIGGAAEAQWDAEAAEALTRVYESAEAQLHRPSASPDPARSQGAKAFAAAPAQTRSAGEEPDRAWLEARLTGIDALLRQALEGVDPDKSLDAVKGRLDQFEARFDAALETVARRSDLDTLALLETQLKELTRQFEQTRGQLARLDNMDDSLRDLALGLERQQPAGQLDSKAIETLIDAAADRAAARIAGAIPAAPAQDNTEAQKRMTALEELLQEYIEERRRGEEVTASILHTIEGALSRIVDRVDAIDVAKPAPPVQEGHEARRDGLDIESERLAQAYAAGARVLGQARGESASSILDAADYASFAPNDDLAHADEPVEDTAAAEDTGEAEIEPAAKKRDDSRLSDLRSKLSAHASAAPGSQPRGDSDRETSKTTRTRFGSRLAMLMLLLFGTGYLIVDVYMSNRPASYTGQPTASRAELQSGTEAAEFNLDTGRATPQASPEPKKSQLAAPADGEQSRPDIVPPPRRPQHVPETVTDDLSQVEPEAGWRSSSLDAPAQDAAPAATATTVALPRGAAAEPMEKARTLSGRGLVALPTSIGPAALRHAAAGGDPDAAFEVATRYAEGKGVTQDLKEAFAWYQRAAAQGHASAQFRVAAFHERGVGVATDRERAILWYRRAAEQGHVKAMHNLAVLLAGKGADRADYETAARWFREAAERGLTDSQYNLAALYEDGRGVAKSLADAYKWFALAARSGDKGAEQRLALLKPRLNPSELASAEQNVASWHVRNAAVLVDAQSGE